MSGRQAAVSLLTKVAGVAFGVGVVSSVLNASVYTVRVGERAVILDRFRSRMDKSIVGEGIHLCIPWLQKPYVFDIRTRPYSFSFVSYTKDFQKVKLTVRVLFHPDISYLPDNHQTLPSIGYEDLDAVVSKFSAHELVTNMMHVSALIRGALASAAEELHIVLDDVSFTHLSFSPEFSMACESKQIAQQQVERKKIWLKKNEQESLVPTIWNEAFEVALSKFRPSASGGDKHQGTPSRSIEKLRGRRGA